MKRKTALITGATTGIGYELAKCFAEHDYDLVLVARHKKNLEERATQFTETYHARVDVFAYDLSEPGNAKKLFGALTGRPIDVLVNNAGFAAYGPFAENTIEDVIGMIRLNIESLTHLTRLILPDMIRRKSGKILNVASTAAFQPGPLMAVYYASKAYVLSFSEALRYEVKDFGITVTALCPGATKTEFQNKSNFKNSNLLKLGMMKAHIVATAGYDGLMNNKAIVVPGFKNKFGAFITRFSPRNLVIKTVYKLNKTE